MKGELTFKWSIVLACLLFMFGLCAKDFVKLADVLTLFIGMGVKVG